MISMDSETKTRLFIEYHELQARIAKLTEFVGSDKIDALPDYDQKDLREQLKHMNAYERVLLRRVGRQCNSA